MKAKYLDEKYERNKILLPPIPQDYAKGEYPLGLVCYGASPQYPFGLREDEWIHHVAIFGRSGSGKTMIANIILANFLRVKKPFLVFDWKRNYRDLLAVYDNILIFTIGRNVSPFSWNPLIPPVGVSPTVWIRKLVEILCHAYFLGEGVTYLLVKALDFVFREHGVYDNSGAFPTFRDVYDWTNNYKSTGREAQWLDSTKRTLAILCFGEFGKAINVTHSASIAEILKENIIMELDALGNSDKTFFIEILLLWIHHYRMGEGERETFKHAILIEEAHHILLKKKMELSGEETITDVILREIRELGESIILIDQHPSLISKPALGNTYTTITMNLKHGGDIATAAESMLISREQREYLGELPTGQAIVKLQGRWFKPFLVKFPFFPLKKGFITDKSVSDKMRGYSGLFGIEELGDNSREVNRVIRGYEKGEKNDSEQPEDEEKLFLQDVNNYPYSGIVERYRRLGFSNYQGNRIKKQLVIKGLAKELDLSNKKGRVRLLELTAEGQKMVDDSDTKTQSGHGKPGIDHEFWKNKIAGYYKSYGYSIKIEKSIGCGRQVDLVATNDNEKIAIEIETGKSDAIFNIRKDIEAGFTRIICVALTTEAKSKINDELRHLNLDKKGKVRVISVNELLD